MSSSIQKAQWSRSSYQSRDPADRAAFRAMMDDFNRQRARAKTVGDLAQVNNRQSDYMRAMKAAHGNAATRYTPLSEWLAAQS